MLNWISWIELFEQIELFEIEMFLTIKLCTNA